MTWNIFLCRFTNYAFELLSICTVLLIATVPKEGEDASFWVVHRYNLCFMCYQISDCFGYFISRFSPFKLFTLLPFIQFSNFLLFCFFGVKSRPFIF